MPLMKLSDWVARKIVETGIRQVFLVTGGGAMHLNHSPRSNPDLKCVFNHHEQACAIAAEGYFRSNNRLALVNVTSGPGGTNTITGVYGAFVDSVGMIVLSGQVKHETTVRSYWTSFAPEYGDQELDIEPLVRPVTKYCVMVTEHQFDTLSLGKGDLFGAFGASRPLLAGYSARRSSRENRDGNVARLRRERIG